VHLNGFDGSGTVDGPAVGIWGVFDMYAIKKVCRAMYATEKLSGSSVPSRELLLTIELSNV